MREIEASITNTIKYAKRYGGELTEDQLFFRLLSGKKYSQKMIRESLNIPGRKEKRGGLNKENERKINLTKKLVSEHLIKFLSIVFVGITGSVAAGNAKKNEDIDILLVCKNGTLWLTRLRLWLYLKLKHIPHRRYGQKEKRDDFCFNLWLEEDSMNLPSVKQNRKNAVDLILMVPILDRGGVYSKFISKNSWAEKYVANGYGEISNTKCQISPIRSKQNMFEKIINTIAFWGQMVFMRLKGPINFVDKDRAFFHETKRV